MLTIRASCYGNGTTVYIYTLFLGLTHIEQLVGTYALSYIYSVFLWIPLVWFCYPEIKAIAVNILKLAGVPL